MVMEFTLHFTDCGVEQEQPYRLHQADFVRSGEGWSIGIELGKLEVLDTPLGKKLPLDTRNMMIHCERVQNALMNVFLYKKKKMEFTLHYKRDGKNKEQHYRLHEVKLEQSGDQWRIGINLDKLEILDTPLGSKTPLHPEIIKNHCERLQRYFMSIFNPTM